MRWLPLLLLVCACSQAPEPQDLVRVRVGFWGGNEPIRAQATLESGARIELVVEPLAACHLYVVHRGPGESARVLYPKNGGSSRIDSVVMVLDAVLDEQTGTETIYVVVSRDPHPGLESVIAGAGKDVLARVQEVRKAFEKVTVPEAKPAPIGGRVRGPPGALEYSFPDVFCHTFTIDHR